MSTPTLTPPSFRVAFGTQLDGQPLEVQQAHKTQWNAITDIYQSIGALNTKVNNVKSSSSATAASVENINSSSETIVEVSSPSIGAVNNQTGATSYATLPSDYGSEIILNSASPIAVTLNTLGSGASIALPWFCSFNNTGTATATLTPSTGTINGAGSLALPGGDFCIVYFDGTNFSAELPATSGSGVTSLNGLAGALSLTSTGSTLTVTPSGSAVDLEIKPTTVTPGSYTNTNLTVNAEGQITAATNGSSAGSLSCTRTDKTGVYLSGVVYTNSSGGAVFEEVEMLASGSGTGADSVLAYTVDGVSHFGNGVWNQCSGHAQVSFWVPNGSTFSATATYIDGGTTPTINKWTEVSF